MPDAGVARVAHAIAENLTATRLRMRVAPGGALRAADLRMRSTFVLPVLLAGFAMALPAQDALTRQALQRIEGCEQALARLPAGDSKELQRCLADLDWAAKRLQAVVRPDEAHAAATRRLQVTRTALEAKRTATPAPAPAPGAAPVDAAVVAQLTKDVAAAAHNFGIVPATMWSDDARRLGMQRDLEGLARRLGALPADAAELQAVRQQFAALQQQFAAAQAKVAGDQAAAGDVAGKVAALLAKYVPESLPAEPEAPYDAARLRAFLLALQQLRERELPADAAFAAAARQNSAIDRQRAESLQHLVTVDWPARIAALQANVAARVEAAVADGQRLAAWLLATDAADRDQVTNRVLARGAFAEQRARLAAAAAAVAAARVHDELTTGAAPAGVSRDEQAQLVERAVAHLQRLAVTALDAVRMPAAASDDAALVATATATLRRPEYGVGAWKRLVVSTAPVTRERREGWIRPDGDRAMVTLYTYRWDEFQVTTAEPVGDEIWLFVHTLRHYHAGDPTTPVGRWVLSQRFESTRMLAENVAK